RDFGPFMEARLFLPFPSGSPQIEDSPWPRHREHRENTLFRKQSHQIRLPSTGSAANAATRTQTHPCARELKGHRLNTIARTARSCARELNGLSLETRLPTPPRGAGCQLIRTGPARASYTGQALDSPQSPVTSSARTAPARRHLLLLVPAASPVESMTDHRDAGTRPLLRTRRIRSQEADMDRTFIGSRTRTSSVVYGSVAAAFAGASVLATCPNPST